MKDWYGKYNHYITVMDVLARCITGDVVVCTPLIVQNDFDVLSIIDLYLIK